MDRRATVIELVRAYPLALQDGGSAGDWIGGGPDSVLLLHGPLWYDAPHVWKAFEVCLAKLKKAKPWPYKNLEARYWNTMDRRKQVRHLRKGRELHPLHLAANEEVKITGGATSSKLVLDCLVTMWPSWVDPREVDRALLFLERTLPDPLYLPAALREEAA